MRLRLPALLAALGLAACATAGRRLQPASDAPALVVGALRFQKAGLPFPDRYADIMHLAPLDAQGGLDYDHPLSSQWAASQQVYFFNVPPGRYAVVGGSFLAHGLRYTFRLSAAQSRQALAEVRPGEVCFLGVVTVKREYQELPAMGLNALKSIAVALPPWRPWKTEVFGSFRLVDTTRVAEVEALTSARRDLAGTLWTPAVSSRLEALGGPVPEVATTGFWRKRPKPVKSTAAFSWVDTLQWGKPYLIKDGLEWRQPRDRARVAVRFLQPGQPGWRSLPDYMRDLRELGSTEDAHAFEDVVVSTTLGHAIRYTKYVYPEPYLTGSVKEVFLTEVTLVPGREGYYVIHYRARRSDFGRYRPEYLRFRQHLQLSPPAKPE